MGYKVLIPTAGTGSRLGGMTKYINKSLVNVGNRPALSRIIESFPEDCEFVIATGYKGELVKEFISLAYPEKKIKFVDIFLYEGEGSGLGLTILACKDYLQEPFVFCACDTIVTEDIPLPDRNWIGYDHRESFNRYRKIHMNESGRVLSLDEKNADYGEMSEPYIGLAGIYDWKLFWDIMEKGCKEAIVQGESYGLRELIDQRTVQGEKFTWFDIGVEVELEATRKRFEGPDAPNILKKSNEAIWFVKNKVIKFSDDCKFISDRVKRAEYLNGFTPRITGSTPHMFCYNYEEGNVLSKCISVPLFHELLKFSQMFWVQKELEKDAEENFYKACMRFYHDKTYERVNQFYKKFEKEDHITKINQVEYPTLKELLYQLDWKYLSYGLPGQFHGDYHFENIIYDERKGVFKFLDWRQNFERSLDIGDIYYDLAKLNHGLIVSHEVIAKDLYTVNWKENEINFDLARKLSFVECENEFYVWLKVKGYDVKKVKILTALIYLNIASLHHYPYGLMLYALGKKMLFESIR